MILWISKQIQRRFMQYHIFRHPFLFPKAGPPCAFSLLLPATDICTSSPPRARLLLSAVHSRSVRFQK